MYSSWEGVKPITMASPSLTNMYSSWEGEKPITMACPSVKDLTTTMYAAYPSPVLNPETGLYDTQYAAYLPFPLPEGVQLPAGKITRTFAYDPDMYSTQILMYINTPDGKLQGFTWTNKETPQASGTYNPSLYSTQEMPLPGQAPLQQEEDGWELVDSETV